MEPKYRINSQDAAARKRSGSVLWIVLATPLLLSTPLMAEAQANYTLNTSVSLYTHYKHHSRPDDNGSSFGLGGTGGFDFGYAAGPHRLGAGYSFGLNNSYNGDMSASTQITGASVYQYNSEAERFNLKAEHDIHLINTGEYLALNPWDYNTQQSATLGGGLNFFLGPLTRLNLSGKLGVTFNGDETQNGTTAKAEAALRRRLSHLSSVGASVSRVNMEEGEPTRESEIDNGKLYYQRRLDHGQLFVSAGLTRAHTNSVDSTEAVTGQVRRDWTGAQTQTSLAYSRAVTSTVLELTQVVPLEGSFELADDQAEEILVPVELVKLEVQSLTLRDQLSLQIGTGRLCAQCRFNLKGIAAQRNELYTDRYTFDYDLSASLNVSPDPVQEASVSYHYQALAEEFDSAMIASAHKVAYRWERQLDENAELSAIANQAWLTEEDREYRFSVRFMFTYQWGPDVKPM